jgi:hypothetical protein
MTEEEAEIGVLLHFRAFRRGDAELVTHDYEELTGNAATTIEGWLEANTSAFR